MSWSVRLFRIKGIDVKVHLTFVLILIWAAFVWGTTDGGGIGEALLGVVAMLLLFVCITLHELAHSFEALRYGLRVHDIILLPIGGVSQIEDLPGKPGQELRIAIVGPLTSFAISIVLYLVNVLIWGDVFANLASPSATLGGQGWFGLVAYLTIANVLLGLFNLIPAFPMDGGRILRALLAMRMDYRRATAIAVAVGQGLAIGLGFLGFLVGNFFLVLIAFFVWIGASQEGGLAQVRGVLGAVRVEQAMTRRPRTLTTGDTLARAVDLTLSTSQSDFPVVDELTATVVGFLTREDVLRGLRHHGAGASVASVMHTLFPVVTSHDLLFEAQQRMVAAGMQAVPVIDDGNLAGLLTTTDVGEAYAVLEAYRETAAAAT